MKRIILIIAAAIAVYPLIWMSLTSLKTNEAINKSMWMAPTQPTLDSYRKVLGRPQGPLKTSRLSAARSLVNSLVIAGTAVLCVTMLAALAGYGFGRFNFRGKRWLWYLFISGLFLPVHVTIIPLHRLEGMMGISRGPGSALFLCMVYIAFNMSFSVYFLRSFFSAVPQEIVDAAVVDGCTDFAVFWRVLLPLSVPALTVVALINAVMIWNEFIFALVLLQSEKFYTLPLMAMYFADETGLDLALTSTVLTLATLPIIALFLAAQRHIITGVSQGALK
ncbi:MAG: raffinose/stachyose/melibiose transport system permease protein [Rhodothermales bacterium]|jgi:raffinose/stachyose/melibiose transport system permease protein